MNEARMKMSVVIGTRDRARSLEVTLDRFFAQKFSGAYDFEVLVVDNGSTDQTKEIIERFVARYPEIVRAIFEPRQGVSNARNRGISQAGGEIIVLTDDDVLVADDWLDQIYHEFAGDPDLRILAGRVLLANEKLQQVSLQESMERTVFGYPDDGSNVLSANMAIRREVFERIGMFDVRLGPGKFFGGADDTELVYRAFMSGYRLLYAPNVIVSHNHDRYTLDQACRLMRNYGKGRSAYLLKHMMSGDKHALKIAYWIFLDLPNWWKRRESDSYDQFQHRRATVKGMLTGFVTAPLVMWGNGQEKFKAER